MFRNTLDKMIQIRDEKKAEDGGFTLIELLVVVVIIGILIAIAIPLYLNYEHGAKDKQAQSDVRAAVSAIQQCYTDNNNTLPAGATSSGTTLTLACGKQGGTTVVNETSPVSSNTTLQYTVSGDNYTVAASASGGSGKTFTFDSATGQITSAATPASNGN